MYVSLFQLGFGWIVFIILLLACIEWYFGYLGVYQPHWWKTPYSMLSFAFYFAMV
jgi:hypothetical protein